MDRFRFLTALPLFILTAACAPMVDTHGDALDADVLDALETGTATRANVAKALGSPSSRTVFDAEDWIYIHSRQERTAFFKPRETERDVVVLKFDRDGVLREKEVKTLKDGRAITPAPQSEQNENSLTILDQLISNAGRMGTDAPVH